MKIKTEDWSSSWHSLSIPEKQGRQARIDLDNWLAGTPHVAFDALREIVRMLPESKLRFLEIGSGSGYHSDIIPRLRHNWTYTGVELSQAMIDYAQKHWLATYIQGDAQNLPFDDAAFDIVMPSAVIQHVPDWRKAVSEACRVSSRFVILHRVHCTALPTCEFVNNGYGEPLPTRENNQGELIEYCRSLGLDLVGETYWGRTPERWQGSFLFTKQESP